MNFTISPNLSEATNLEERPDGLADVLNGMRNGPHGQAGSAGSSGGMSTIVMGLLALLAYKAVKGTGGGGSEGVARPQGPDSSASPRGDVGASDWLSRIGNMVAGGAAGSVLSGGLGELLKKFQQAGRGEAAQSWVSHGSNQPVAQDDLEKAIGSDTLDQLAERTGIPRDRILAELKENLPRTVDSLHARRPDAD